MNPLLLILCVLAGLILLAGLGLRIRPAPFPPFPSPGSIRQTMPLPQDLPDPVQRFYRQMYDEEVPIIESAVISGRAWLRLGGIKFPGRFRFSHIAGQDYRHYIEVSFLGLPLFKVNESYIGGKGRMELPFSVIENEAKIDQAANLGLWAESIWLPAIFLSDRRVRWETVDVVTAWLVVPFGSAEERFLVRFDPQTGMPRLMESMRYRDAADAAKILWINDARHWGELHGKPVLRVGAITWFDQGRAWAVFEVEELVFNADLKEYILARGL